MKILSNGYDVIFITITKKIKFIHIVIDYFVKIGRHFEKSNQKNQL